jgi:hypothetical protein
MVSNCKIVHLDSLLSANRIDLIIIAIDEHTDSIIITCRQCTVDNHQSILVKLCDLWSNSKLKIGAKIRIFGASFDDELMQFIVDSKSTIIYEPDTLITPTSITSAVYCARKVALNERFRSGSIVNKAFLIGNVVHNLFQVD